MTDSEKLDLILSKIGQMESKIEFKLDRLEAEMGEMKSRMSQLESRMDQVEAEMGQMKSRGSQLESRMEQMESNIRSMKLMIENEICVNIRRIAEGHLDLSRNLHEALKVETEKEMLSIRVNVLESEMRKVKEHLRIA